VVRSVASAAGRQIRLRPWRERQQGSKNWQAEETQQQDGQDFTHLKLLNHNRTRYKHQCVRLWMCDFLLAKSCNFVADHFGSPESLSPVHRTITILFEG
jgi:hypothetical protein